MIRSTSVSYKIGFVSAFPTQSNFNPNVIDELKKQSFLGNQRLQNRLIASFKRGYYECEKLIKEVNIDNAFKNIKKDDPLIFS